MSILNWMYRGGHPNKTAKLLNRNAAFLYSFGMFPNYLVKLEVVGRKSGKPVSFPLVMTVMNGKRYIVSMLGKETNWVKNLEAAGGKATLIHGKSEQVSMTEVEIEQRAPILKAYLRRAGCSAAHAGR